jgi:hypothetical protein
LNTTDFLDKVEKYTPKKEFNNKWDYFNVWRPSFPNKYKMCK